MDLKVGDAIKYNFLYSNEEVKFGVVTKINRDVNFAYMIYIAGQDNEIDIIPYNIMEFDILGKK
jgi:hypothetical protein